MFHYYSGEWGTVCDDGWSSTNGRVVCKQLGYRDYVGRLPTRSVGNGPIWMDDVVCSASDSRLQDCSFRGWGRHDCAHIEDVGIMCSKFN